MSRFVDRFGDRVCGSCARPAIGWGYVPPGYGNKKIIWCCDNLECLAIAKDSYGMNPRDFTRLDSIAAIAGGEVGGAYLDEIDKTDLAQMTEEEWHEFCRRIVGGYREALQTTLRDEAPF